MCQPVPPCRKKREKNRILNDMKDEYIIKTDYFNKPGIWIARALRFFLAILVLYVIDLYELEPGSDILMIGYISIGLLAIFFLIWPIDEMALDKDNLYFIKKSLLPVANKTTRYPLSDFKRIGTYNISKQVSLFTLFVPLFNLYRVEFTFKDDSSKSEDLTITKKDLKEILLKANELIN